MQTFQAIQFMQPSMYMQPQYTLNQVPAKQKRPQFKPHSKFTAEDDDRLKELVAEYGDNAWLKIAELMPGRNSRQCRERWMNYLSPSLNTQEWTTEEDTLLIQKQKELGTSWVRISKFFEGRTDQMCKNRFFMLKRKAEKKPYKRRNISLSMFHSAPTPSYFCQPFYPMANYQMPVAIPVALTPQPLTPTSSSESSTIGSPIQNYSDLSVQSPVVTETSVIEHNEDQFIIDSFDFDSEPNNMFDFDPMNMDFADDIFEI